jgi:hypothetical protein
MKAKFKRACSAKLGLAVALALAAGAAWSGSRIFTSDADFAQGVLDGVVVGGGQIVLGTVGSTFDLLWVANAGEDTVSKIDTKNNKELARYRTWFGPAGTHGAWDGPAPSRTAVDTDGNVFVANRHFDGRPAQLMKILSGGGVDRNNNGVIDTSFDANTDGMIDNPGEMKDLVDSNNNGILDAAELADERVAWAVQVGNPGGIGRAVCIGTDGNVWVGLYDHQEFWKVNGATGAIMSGPHSVPWTPYGCAVDRNGILWSATLGSDLGRMDTNNPIDATTFYVESTYGIAIGNGKVYLGGNCAYKEFTPGPNTYVHRDGVCDAGISVDGNGDIVTGSGNAAKYSKTDGSEIWQNMTNPASYAVGVVVDGDNNVWQVDLYNNQVTKFDGATGNFLATLPVGTYPYTYSDATGIAARTQTSHTGFWTIILDGGSDNTKWYKVCWQANVPNGGDVDAESRADNSQANLNNQNFANRDNCTPLLQVGRYLELRAKLTANQGDESPSLLQIAVQTRPCDVDGDNDVDNADIALIRAALNTNASGFADPRDADGNSRINTLDMRTCTQQCTRAGCATQ